MLPLRATTSRSHYFPKEDIRSRPYYYADVEQYIWEGSMNQLVIENMHFTLLSIVQTGGSV